MMFETIRKLFQRKKPDRPAPKDAKESAAVSVPEVITSEAERPASWNPKRIYANRAERQRAGDNLPSDLGEHREPMKS
jgi:hypothetical protein